MKVFKPLISILVALCLLFMPLMANAGSDYKINTVEGTGADINVSIGFQPSLVICHNVDGFVYGYWDTLMADDSMLKIVNGTSDYNLVNEIRSDLNTVLTNTATWNPGTIGNGTCANQDIVVPGAALGDLVLVSAPYSLVNANAYGSVTSSNTVTMSVCHDNTTTNKILTGSATWNPGAIGTNAVAASAISVTGAALGDFAIVAPPYGLLNASAAAFVNATDSVVVNIINNSGESLTFGSGTWKVKVFSGTVGETTVTLASGTWRAKVLPNGALGGISNSALTSTADRVQKVVLNGIAPYAGSTTAAEGYTVGADTDLNVSGNTIDCAAWR